MHSAVMQSLWSSKLDNMLCGNFRLTGPDSSCTDFCTSCSRTCNHSAVMQSLWSSKLHNMLCGDFWLTGPNFSRTEFCTSCSRTCKRSAVRLSFWSSYTVCCAEVSDQLVQTFHHLMQKSPNELERENLDSQQMEPKVCVHSTMLQGCTVQFSLSWYLCTRKSPNALHLVSQKFL